MSQQVDDLLHLANEAGIPEPIMSYLIDNEIIANLNDICRITPEEVIGIRNEYDQNTKQHQTNQTFGHFL